MLKQLTKSLFCRNRSAQDLSIVDGEMIDLPEMDLPCPVVSTEINQAVPMVISVAKTMSPVVDTGPKTDLVLPSSGIPEQYLIFLGSSGRSTGTIIEYNWDLKWWQRQTGALQDMNRHSMEKILNNMHPATARRKIASLRSYGKWLLREGDHRLHSQLSQIIPPRTPGRIPKDRGSDAFRELSNQAFQYVKDGDRRGIWLGLMICCGLRISEIQTVKNSPGDSIKVVGKGNKERLIPAPAWLRKAIVKKVKKNTVWRKDRKLIWLEMKKIGIKKPHSLRHTYASELVRQDFKLEQVQLLLGHAKLETTLIYARVKLPENVTIKLGIEQE